MAGDQLLLSGTPDPIYSIAVCVRWDTAGPPLRGEHKQHRPARRRPALAVMRAQRAVCEDARRSPSAGALQASTRKSPAPDFLVDRHGHTVTVRDMVKQGLG